MMYEIMTPAEAKALGGLTLAFFGDSVYEVYVREQIVRLGTMPVDKLHKKAVQYVNAGFQSYAYDIIAEQLTEEETEIFKRGRNATGNNVPRPSNPKDYRRATGMEAIFGYLYLTGQNDRIKELFEKIYTSERT